MRDQNKPDLENIEYIRKQERIKKIERRIKKSKGWIIWLTDEITDIQFFTTKDYDKFVKELERHKIEFLGYRNLLTIRFRISTYYNKVLER